MDWQVLFVIMYQSKQIFLNGQNNDNEVEMDDNAKKE